MPFLDTARMQEGLRVYAIGDVHGCLDLLRTRHDWIAADLARRPVADWRIVHVGDYVDRGPDSAGVISYLIGRQAEDDRIVCLLGNHDAFFADVMGGVDEDPRHWLSNGGASTLISYGFDWKGFIRSEPPTRLREKALPHVPESHLGFLADLKPMVGWGDYIFVHAGIEPGVPLADQRRESLIWIRDRFLDDPRDFGAVVVHGHTIREDGPEVRPNRIDIDTGAFVTGRLSCIVLEGTEQALLTPRGPVPLMPG